MVVGPVSHFIGGVNESFAATGGLLIFIILCPVKMIRMYLPYAGVVMALWLLLPPRAMAEEYLLTSPDGRVEVTVAMEGSVSYSVSYAGKSLVQPSRISMELSSGEGLPGPFEISDVSRSSVREEILPQVPLKRSVIPDVYNLLRLQFGNGVELQFRAYDDGIAYRFASHLPAELTVLAEEAEFHLSRGALVYYPQVKKRPGADLFHTSFEEPYQVENIDTISVKMMAFSPIMVRQEGLPTLLITDSDIRDYPGMFLGKGKGTSLKGVFAPYPAKERDAGEGFRYSQVVDRAGFIARSGGERTFPWRVIAIAPTDADLLTNDLVYRLATPPSHTDFSWIKPGLSTEEWITGANLYGVDFISGINTATYKYYIDFASRFGFEYVMLDAGWSDVNDLFTISPGMDMEEITAYARLKGIGLILWTQALTLDRQMEEVFPVFRDWGIKVVMTDFIDRDDQLAINFMHRFAERCAEYSFMCMIHGAPKPAGFSRTWPNMLTREGLLGSEYNAWSSLANPVHDLLLPFIRMASGPMDYEPGLMQHASREQPSKLGFEKVIAQGTRMHQLAMFVVYESPLQLFSGNISDALREPELMTFLGKIPTVWDETRILEARAGQYIVEARRKGNEWYLAAINDWNPAEFVISLGFTGGGLFLVEKASDGINAARNPHDFILEEEEVSSNGTLTIRLAPGGGFVARLRPTPP